MKITFKPKPKLPLETFRLQHFKAVRDSGMVTFTPLTVFIGNNGSGKSSLIEALEALQVMVVKGLDDAFMPWRGFDHIWNKATSHQLTEDQVGNRRLAANPMRFEVSGKLRDHTFSASFEVSTDLPGNRVFIAYEDVAPISGWRIPERSGDNRLYHPAWRDFVHSWQFLNLNPQAMLDPQLQRLSEQRIWLARDGSNIAQYLQSIADKDPSVLEDIAETLKSVLPYATDLRPALTTELQRTVYLRLYEDGIAQDQVIPSWLISQGTLRIISLLAVLRHPTPPSVVFIEELENGLDPRTIHLVIEEIRSFLQSGGQVVATTHSPYLLDLLDLSQIVVVERGCNDVPEFNRPLKRKLKSWAEKFAPGKLYTMGNLTKA